MNASPAIRISTIAAAIVAVIAVAAQFTPVLGDATSEQLAFNQRVSLAFVDSGKKYLNEGKLGLAQTAFESAIVANPSNGEAYTYLARAEQKAEVFDTSRWHYETALKIDPDNVQALSWGGEVDLKLNSDTKAATAKLEKIKRICGENCPQYSALSSALSTSQKKPDVQADKPQADKQSDKK